MITKQDITDYADLTAEIQELQQKLCRQKRQGAESLRCPWEASVPGHSFCPADGWNDTAKRWAEQKHLLEKKRTEIERFSETLPRAGQRRIVRMRMDGFSWGEIAAKMGHRYSVDSTRKIFERLFLKKRLESSGSSAVSEMSVYNKN